MKYIVIVNGHLMVTVEAQSLCSAEHEILDNIHYGITAAQAFGPEEIKTECFWGMLQGSEAVSMEELERMSDQAFKDRQHKLDEMADQIRQLQTAVTELGKAREIMESMAANGPEFIRTLASISNTQDQLTKKRQELKYRQEEI